MEQRTERPLLSRERTGSSLATDLGVLVVAFPHLKPTATSREWSEKLFEGRPSHTSNRPPPPGQREGGMNTFAQKGDAPPPQLYCCATRAWEGARKAQAPVLWLTGTTFGARTPTAECMPPLRGTALQARVPVAELGP